MIVAILVVLVLVTAALGAYTLKFQQATRAIGRKLLPASLLSEIVDLVKEAHSYRVPEIIAMPIIGGDQDYLN